ncbi:MAG: hypothetical protein N2039_00100 [Gemmataceae bacterium]|nr:hypothetical protein [Gemmataceae bacterium]
MPGVYGSLLWLVASIGPAAPPLPPCEVVEAKPRPDLAAAFARTEGWTGADGAYSIPLNERRTLWLFGDTWIGRIENGRRVASRLINNSGAWQDLSPPSPPRFFWRGTANEPAALLPASTSDTWLWPGDGAVVQGKLFLFVHVVRRQPKGPPAFQFDWFADELWCIDEPTEEPTKWSPRRLPLDPRWRWGVACRVSGEHLFVYSLPNGPRRPLEAPVVVGRTWLTDLVRGQPVWETLAEGDRWTTDLDAAQPIFRDGASEMSVQQVRGFDGFWAVYMPLGISRDIVVRHAPTPAGPWSQPLKVYRCPKEEKDLFVYAAKGHAELSEKDGQIIITYCRNLAASLGEHVKRPDVYRPQFVEVQLQPKTR